MNQRTVELVPYSPMWKTFFNKESSVLKKLLRSNFIETFHIGSTAIPAIVAKPTLDILGVVHTLDGIEAFKSDFERAGYVWKGDNGIEGRLFFIRLAPNGIDHLCHIHLFESHSEHIRNHLDFRDYLNAEDEVAKEYENIKVTLKNEFPNSPELYTAGKDEFIKTILKNIT